MGLLYEKNGMGEPLSGRRHCTPFLRKTVETAGVKLAEVKFPLIWCFSPSPGRTVLLPRNNFQLSETRYLKWNLLFPYCHAIRGFARKNFFNRYYCLSYAFCLTPRPWTSRYSHAHTDPADHALRVALAICTWIHFAFTFETRDGRGFGPTPVAHSPGLFLPTRIIQQPATQSALKGQLHV